MDVKRPCFFKSNFATRAGFSVENPPYRQPFVEYLRSEKEKGRRIILATAAHRSIAESVAVQLGLFDSVLASDEGRNLRVRVKLEAIREMVGERFDYARDSVADLPIGEAAEALVLVGTSV